MGRKPKVDQAHEIGKDGVSLVDKLLRPSFQPTINENDYGEDIYVKCFDPITLESNSKFFIIQVKTHKEKSPLKSGVISESIDTANLVDYKDQTTATFLISVCLKSESAHYLFLQEYLDKLPKGIKSKGKQAVYLPKDNDLKNLEAFRAEVERAIIYVATHKSGTTIEKMVEAKEEELNKQDPRYEHEVSVFNREVQVTRKPKGSEKSKDKPKEIEKLKGELKIKGKEALEKYQKSLDEGIECKLNKPEFDISGLPEDFKKPESITIHVNRKKLPKGELSIIGLDENGAELARIGDMRGKFTGGRKIQKFESTDKNMFLDSLITMNLDTMKFGINMGVNPDAFIGRQMLLLPKFEEVYSFLKSGAKMIEAELHVDGKAKPIVMRSPFDY